MMFTGLVIKQKPVQRLIAIMGVALLLLVNILEMNGIRFFTINTEGFLLFDRFGLLFSSIAFGCTLVFYLLSAKDMEKVSKDYSEFFAYLIAVHQTLHESLRHKRSKSDESGDLDSQFVGNFVPFVPFVA